MRILYTTFILIICAGVGLSDTVYVPDDFNTIQIAIDQSSPYDTIIVKPGNYPENIDFKGKPVTVVSQQGAHNTCIDGSDITTVVTFSSGEGKDSVLDGFTVTNGKGAYDPIYYTIGGGIYCRDHSSPSILNCVIEKNGGNAGDGIACRNNSSPYLAYNTIKEHAVTFRGAGLFCCDFCSPEIVCCAVLSNQADYGAGIYCENQCHPNITNSLLADNNGTLLGGAIYCEQNSNATVLYSTIAGNNTYGIVSNYSSTVTVTDSILWDNTWYELHAINGGQINVTYSDVKGGWPGAGNIDQDPLFIDPAAGDYHLAYSSPCRNAGTAITPPGEDFEGDPRIADGYADMGSDEFHRHLYYIGEATPGNTIDTKIVGLPGSAPVAFAVGFYLMDPPMQSPYGPWYLGVPQLFLMLPPIPSSGYEVLSGTLPPPAPYSFHLQAIVGSHTTNPCSVYVE